MTPSGIEPATFWLLAQCPKPVPVTSIFTGSCGQHTQWPVSIITTFKMLKKNIKCNLEHSNLLGCDPCVCWSLVPRIQNDTVNFTFQRKQSQETANTGDMRQYTSTVVKVSAQVRCMGSASDDTHTHTVPCISCVDYPTQTDGPWRWWPNHPFEHRNPFTPRNSTTSPKCLNLWQHGHENLKFHTKCLHTCETGGLSSRSTSCWNPYTLYVLLEHLQKKTHPDILFGLSQ